MSGFTCATLIAKPNSLSLDETSDKKASTEFVLLLIIKYCHRHGIYRRAASHLSTMINFRSKFQFYAVS